MLQDRSGGCRSAAVMLLAAATTCWGIDAEPTRDSKENSERALGQPQAHGFQQKDRSQDPRRRQTGDDAEADPREHELWKLTNKTRAAAGLPELLWDHALAAAAKAHAKDMALDDYFSHQTHDRENGRLVATISARDRIRSFSLVGCAENIAKGQELPQEVVTAWMSSQGHRANILTEDHVSCGTAFDSGYWVQVFGRRAD
jgi:uncharacterized protein YkwD